MSKPFWCQWPETVAWLSMENRRRSQLLGPECDLEKAKLSSVSFFILGKGWWGWEIFGSCTSSFTFRFFLPYIDCFTCCHFYQGLEGGHFCFSPSFLFSRVSLLSVRNVMPQFYNLLTLWNLKRIDCLFVSSFGSSNSQAKHVTSNRGALWDMELSRLDEKEKERETVVEDVSVFVFLFPRGFLDWV